MGSDSSISRNEIYRINNVQTSRWILPGLYTSMGDVANGVDSIPYPYHSRTWDETKGFVFGQLTEPLTNYGDVPMLIIDGWTWRVPLGGHRHVPYQEIRDTIKKMQPNCLRNIYFKNQCVRIKRKVGC